MTMQSNTVSSYNQCDQHLHLLCQPLAKINRSLVPPKADDSHTNIAFDSLEQRLLGRWFASNGNAYLMGIDLKKLNYVLYDEERSELTHIPFLNRSIKDIELDLQIHLGRLGIQKEDLFAPLHFEISPYPFKEEAFQAEHFEGLALWMDLRKNANEACMLLQNHLQAQGETRIWPHHFDTGIYMEIAKQAGLGFGLAMADDMMNEPYFYFSRYDLGENKFNWTNAPKLSAGKWIIEESFRGALLPANQTVGIIPFLDEVNSYYLR